MQIQIPKIPSIPSLRNIHNLYNKDQLCLLFETTKDQKDQLCFSPIPCLSVSGNPSNKKKLKLTVKCRSSPKGPIPTQASPPRFFVAHSIYKGKAALTVDPISPEFTPLSTGVFKITKEGFVQLQFAAAIVVQQYDWDKKQVFALSVAEIGALVCLGPNDSLEFFHDPFKGTCDEGKVTKILKAEPFPDGSGHFFNLNVQNKLLNVDEKIHIPITKAELAVLKSAFNYILPYLLGWHTFVNSINPTDKNRVYTTAPQPPRPSYGPELDYEWSR